MKKKVRITLSCVTVVAGILSAAGLFVWYCDRMIAGCEARCYDDLSAVPPRETALVPGAARITPAGIPNCYFQSRVAAAAQLYHAGKVRHILISGDNSRRDYNEPRDMFEALRELDVPESAMTLDYAGFRTLDSVVRAKTAFGCDRIVIVSQRFHAARAVYIARKHGIDAIGFVAVENVSDRVRRRNHFREYFARVAAWLDVNVWHRPPKFVR
ncbi:MAG: YdcF family protein [Lentisphaeria bacterium]|nr:YdcF family protein [Lentisphaeria bacterium]